MRVKADEISKKFSGKPGVNAISFEAMPGKVVGILGPPEAGKTATLRMVMNILKPDSGAVYFDEKPMNSRIRAAIGYLPEQRGLYKHIPLHKLLVYYARLKNLPRKKAHVEAVRLMDRFNVIEQMDTTIAELDPELQQKVQIMTAIIHNPEVLILDEPFQNMDPLNQTLIRKLVQRFREDKKTIIIASSQINEAENICDEVLILNQGNSLLHDKVEKIRKKFHDNLIIVEAQDNLNSLKDIYGVKKLIQEKQTARLYVDDEVPTQKILDVIIRSVNISRLEVKPPTLHDIFLQKLNDQQGEGA